MAECLPASLRRDHALQTRHLGQINRTLTQMVDSLGSIKESHSDVATNSLAVITCICDMHTATTGVAQEVSALTQAVQDNTRAVQANTAALTLSLNRIAVALEGRPAGGQSPGEAPPSPAPPQESPLVGHGRGRPRRSSRRRH